MIFQHFSLLEMKSVYKNIALPLECRGVDKKEIEKKVLELAKIVGIEDKLNVRPRMLSGGQKQRVAIARALATNPKVLLCDEATSALDPMTTKQILALLKDINKNFGITIIIVTHQMEVVKEVCERICVMENGKVLGIGSTSDLFLSTNSVLKGMIAEDEILPSDGRNIRILFPKEYSGDTLITKMARDLDINFSICWGKLEKFLDDVLGSLIINVKEEDFENVKDYLSNRNERWEEVK